MFGRVPYLRWRIKTMNWNPNTVNPEDVETLALSAEDIAAIEEER
jgi:hypothetical protein